ncbi:DNA-binding response regulator [Lewinellaceae bacterium SD302]|nr:DNA-binding response regulator [Lewinellaceae bacterium SD302]
MNELSIVAIDDEVLALDLLEHYIRQTPYLELSARFQTAVEAIELLQRKPPNILLLDVQMPGLSGLNLLRSLNRPPVTILTTAYPDYALQAFELDVADYLLKPFSYERFLRAIGKAKGNKVSAATNPAEVATTITVKTDGRLLRIPIEDILYLEGYREYVGIHTAEGRHLVLTRMHLLEEQLPESRFIRIHKSYLVAVDKVTALEGNQLEVNGKLLPVSRQRKEVVVGRLFG